MFDIGFWELTLIAVVALLVVGPERLPSMARTVGLWVGRIRRYVQHVKDDIEDEIRNDELKKMLDQPDDITGLGDVISETRDAVSTAHREVMAAEAEAEADTEAEETLATSNIESDGPPVDAGASESGSSMFEDAAPAPDESLTTRDERRA